MLVKAALLNLHEKLTEGRIFGLHDFLLHAKNFDPVDQARTPRELVKKLNEQRRYGYIRFGDLLLGGRDDREKLEVITCKYDGQYSKLEHGRRCKGILSIQYSRDELIEGMRYLKSLGMR